MTSEDDFAPIWEESILLAEHEAVQASVDVGGWLSAALDDPNVCEQMKADINRWFSSGFLYLDSVRQLMQADREAVRAEQAAEIERLKSHLEDAKEIIQKQIKQAAELAKYKALAETLAGALKAYAEYCDICHGRGSIIEEDSATGADLWRDCPGCGPATEALRQYKEARDAS